MNVKQLIATAALIFATGAAFAQSTDSIRPDANFAAGKTRAEVIAELEQAIADGSYVVGGEEFPHQVPVRAQSNRGRSGTTEFAQIKPAAPRSTGAQ